MQHQANNTEFSLASGVFTKNINKSIIHCVFSVMSRACCNEQTTQSLAWRQVCSQRTSTKRCMWRTRCRLAQSSSTPTTRRTLPRHLVDSNSPASAKIWVKKKREILCCLIPVGNCENFSCIVGSLLLQQDWCCRALWQIQTVRLRQRSRLKKRKSFVVWYLSVTVKTFLVLLVHYSYNKTDVAAPFGRFKQSGFGKDLG